MNGSILTKAQEAELRRIKQYLPYRIVWAKLDENGGFEAYASHDKRAMNKALREPGTCVVALQ